MIMIIIIITIIIIIIMIIIIIIIIIILITSLYGNLDGYFVQQRFPRDIFMKCVANVLMVILLTFYDEKESRF